jgi:hypothetical protein
MGLDAERRAPSKIDVFDTEKVPLLLKIMTQIYRRIVRGKRLIKWEV